MAKDDEMFFGHEELLKKFDDMFLQDSKNSKKITKEVEYKIKQEGVKEATKEMNAYAAQAERAEKAIKSVSNASDRTRKVDYEKQFRMKDQDTGVRMVEKAYNDMIADPKRKSGIFVAMVNAYRAQFDDQFDKLKEHMVERYGELINVTLPNGKLKYGNSGFGQFTLDAMKRNLGGDGGQAFDPKVAEKNIKDTFDYMSTMMNKLIEEHRKTENDTVSWVKFTKKDISEFEHFYGALETIAKEKSYEIQDAWKETHQYILDTYKQDQKKIKENYNIGVNRGKREVNNAEKDARRAEQDRRDAADTEQIRSFEEQAGKAAKAQAQVGEAAKQAAQESSSATQQMTEGVDGVQESLKRARENIKQLEDEYGWMKVNVERQDSEGIFSKYLVGEDGNIKSSAQLASEVESELRAIAAKVTEDYKKGIQYSTEDLNKMAAETFRKVSAGQSFGLLDYKFLDKTMFKNNFETWEKQGDEWYENAHAGDKDDLFSFYGSWIRHQEALNVIRNKGEEEYAAHLEKTKELNAEIQAAEERYERFEKTDVEKTTMSQEDADARAASLSKEKEALDGLISSVEQYKEKGKAFRDVDDEIGTSIYNTNGFKTMSKQLEEEINNLQLLTAKRNNQQEKIFTDVFGWKFESKNKPPEELENYYEELYDSFYPKDLKQKAPYTGEEAIELLKKKAEELGVTFDETTKKWVTLSSAVGGSGNQQPEAQQEEEAVVDLQKMNAELSSIYDEAKDLISKLSRVFAEPVANGRNEYYYKQRLQDIEDIQSAFQSLRSRLADVGEIPESATGLLGIFNNIQNSFSSSNELIAQAKDMVHKVYDSIDFEAQRQERELEEKIKQRQQAIILAITSNEDYKQYGDSSWLAEYTDRARKETTEVDELLADFERRLQERKQSILAEEERAEKQKNNKAEFQSFLRGVSPTGQEEYAENFAKYIDLFNSITEDSSTLDAAINKVKEDLAQLASESSKSAASSEQQAEAETHEAEAAHQAAETSRELAESEREVNEARSETPENTTAPLSNSAQEVGQTGDAVEEVSGEVDDLTKRIGIMAKEIKDAFGLTGRNSVNELKEAIRTLFAMDGMNAEEKVMNLMHSLPDIFAIDPNFIDQALTGLDSTIVTQIRSWLKSNPIKINDAIISELGDNYKSARELIGFSGFSKTSGTDPQIAIQQMNEALGTTIEIGGNAQDAISNLLAYIQSEINQNKDQILNFGRKVVLDFFDAEQWEKFVSYFEKAILQVEQEGDAAVAAVPKKEKLTSASHEAAEAAREEAEAFDDLSKKYADINNPRVLKRISANDEYGSYKEVLEDEDGLLYNYSHSAQFDPETGDFSGFKDTITSITTMYTKWEQTASKAYSTVITKQRELEEAFKESGGVETDKTRSIQAIIEEQTRVFNEAAEAAKRYSKQTDASLFNYDYTDFEDIMSQTARDTNLALDYKYAKGSNSQKNIEATTEFINKIQNKLKDLQTTYAKTAQKPIVNQKHLEDLQSLIDGINTSLNNLSGKEQTLGQRLDITDQVSNLRRTILEYQRSENPTQRELSGKSIDVRIVQAHENILRLIHDAEQFGSVTEDTTKKLYAQLAAIEHIDRIRDRTTGGHRDATVEEQANKLDNIKKNVDKISASYRTEKKIAQDTEKGIISLLRQRARAMADMLKYAPDTVESNKAAEQFDGANAGLRDVDFKNTSNRVGNAFLTTARQEEAAAARVRSELLKMKEVYDQSLNDESFGEKAADNLERMFELFGSHDINNLDIVKLFEADPKEFIRNLAEARSAYKDFTDETKKASKIENIKDSFGTLKNSFEQLEASGKRFPGIASQIKVLEDELQNLGSKSPKELAQLKKRIDDLQNSINKLSKSDAPGISKVADSISKLFNTTVGRYLSIYRAVGYVRKLYSAIKEVDTALTELRKVSDASSDRLTQSFQKSTESARSLGAEVTDVINVTSDWARLGYSIDDAEKLAYYTTLFEHVGDNMDAEKASSYLISTLHGFQLEADEVGQVIDKYNEVSNNFAIDTAGEIMPDIYSNINTRR